MNGTDSICAILTVVLILIFAPLVQRHSLMGEVKYAVLKEAAENMAEDREYVITVGKILGIDAGYERIITEAKRNAEFKPYIYRLFDPRDPENYKGGMDYFGF